MFAGARIKFVLVAKFLKQLFKSNYFAKLLCMHLVLFVVLAHSIGLSTLPFARDELANEKPDNYDLKLAHQDSLAAQTLGMLDRDLTQPTSIEITSKIDKLEKQTDDLKKLLGEENLLPITSHELWEMIFKYIMDNIEQFLKDNTVEIKIPMRYNFCVFVMPIVFTNYFLVFPAFYKFLIPSKVKSMPLVKDFLTRFDKFLNFVKDRSQKELLITVHIKRTKSVKEDFEMIRQIPTFIVSDPIKIIRWMKDFNVEAKGYTPQMPTLIAS